MASRCAARPLAFVCAPIALAVLTSGCAAPAGEESVSSQDALDVIVTPPHVLPQLNPIPLYYAAGPNQTVRMAPATGFVCLLESVSGAFDFDNLPAIQIYESGGSYWLSAGVNTTASAACVSWGAFAGATISANLSLTTRVVDPGSTDESITGDQAATLDTNAADACFLWGIHGDWLTGDREPSGVYTRVNAASITRGSASQSFEVWTNGAQAGADAVCYGLPNHKPFKQRTYSATWTGATSVALPNKYTALCGLSTFEGGLNGWNDGAEIVVGADGSQTLEIHYESWSYLWVTATCIPYTQ